MGLRYFLVLVDAMIDAPGIYTIPAEEYHADPCVAPSLSSSIARLMIDASPWHAWMAHPKLNPAYQAEESERFDLGTAAHALLIEGDESHFHMIDAEDYRTKAAQGQRAAARLNGKTPLLAEQWVRLKAMVDAGRRQCEAFADRPRPFFVPGVGERTLIWREDGGVWCRARLDWMDDAASCIDDYKTTEGSANPEAWIRRHLYPLGFDIQAAFYLRGLHNVAGKWAGRDAMFRFVVQEAFEPYAVSVIGLGPEALRLAEKKVEWAINQWRHCLAANHWPGYPTRTCWADLPPWEETRWEQRRYRDAGGRVAPVDLGRPIADEMADTTGGPTT